MKSSTNSGFAHTTDADFRTWVAEFSAMLTAAGFPKSADTGQIDTATVTIPGTNTYGGYEIRYLNDSLHATKPLYVKIEFGTGTSAGRPLVRVSAASGTNGAGTLSGTTYFSASVLFGSSTIAGGPNYFSAACSVEGCAWFVIKRGAVLGYSPFFGVARTCDGTGAPTTAGFNFYWTNAGASLSRTTYISASVSDSASYALVPGGVTSSLVSGGPQVFRHFTFTPEIRCVPFFVSYLTAELPDVIPITATPISTSRTYLPLDGSSGPISCGAGSSNATNIRIAPIWED